MPDDGDDAAGAAGADQPGVATASYVSTQAIIDREYRLLARRQLGLPGFWRRFVRRRLAVAVLVVVVIVAPRPGRRRHHGRSARCAASC